MFEVIEPKHPKRIKERTVDTLQMLYGEGKTLEQLGYFLGVSRERIRQLLDQKRRCTKCGVTREKLI